ncbi:XdhC family protein [Rhodococcus sp. NPDC057529]|uniref:XdhC family protein n=1 Tax=Rhodococcus sp. NPDC057529 TaxID=3346158 RepID=UPI003672BB87
MRAVLDALVRQLELDEPCALATIVRTSRSAPAAPGTAMLVRADGSAVGSLSGGCIEGAVHDVAATVLTTGAPVIERYGLADDEFEVGLPCGGEMEILVEQLTPADRPDLIRLRDDVKCRRMVAVATVLEHPSLQHRGRHLTVSTDDHTGSTGSAHLDAVFVEQVRELMRVGRSEVMQLTDGGESTISAFVEVMAPTPRMIIYGATEIGSAVARQGRLLGNYVTLCDARTLFATRDRFPDVDELIVEWPHRHLSAEVTAGRVDENTVLCILTHDPKFDIPLLDVALRLPHLGYIGAMGSRRIHQDRVKQLREAGLGRDELARLHSPIGLDLGAHTPAETAVSIVAEIVASRHGGEGRSLRSGAGPIHHRRNDAE